MGVEGGRGWGTIQSGDLIVSPLIRDEFAAHSNWVVLPFLLSSVLLLFPLPVSVYHSDVASSCINTSQAVCFFGDTLSRD